jgi:hypothetical protein
VETRFQAFAFANATCTARYAPALGLGDFCPGVSMRLSVIAKCQTQQLPDQAGAFIHLFIKMSKRAKQIPFFLDRHS